MTRAGIGGLVAAVLLAACGTTSSQSPRSADADASHLSSPSLEGITGGTVTVSLDQVPTTLNDHTVAGDNPSTRYVASAIWPQVFQIGPGPTPVLDTEVVTSAELVNVDPQTVVYQINPHATWSDGVPIDASDFVYSWEAQHGGETDVDGSPDSVASTLGYRDILSVTGSNGGKTVTVVFRTPFGDWASLFDDLLPAHIAQRVGWNKGFDTFDPSVLVSGGPWEVASWQPGTQIVLVRNPHWWGPAPHLDRIVVDSASSGAALESALRSGTSEIAYPATFDAPMLAQLSSSASLETRVSLGTTMLQLVFNTRTTPLDNASVREGIAHAIDRADLVTSLVQPLDPSVWEDNNHLFANTQPQYVDDGSGYVEPDPATADRLLAEGGLVPDVNGTWTLHGSPVTVDLVWAEDDPWSSAVEPALAANLVNAGFDVTSKPVTSSELIGTVLPSGAFDLAIAPMSATPYPTFTGAYFSSDPLVTGEGPTLNWSGLDDPKLDTLFFQAAQQLGSNEAQPLYQQLDQELWTDMPSLPLFAEPVLLAHSAWVSGVNDDPGGLGPFFSLEHWFRLAAAPSGSTHR